jgi:hypothetical protein
MSNETHQAMARRAELECIGKSGSEKEAIVLAGIEKAYDKGYQHGAEDQRKGDVAAQPQRSESRFNIMEQSFMEEQAQHEDLRLQCGNHANQLARMIAGNSFCKMNKADRDIVENHLIWLQTVSGTESEQPPATDDRVKEQGSNAVGQEWTVDHIIHRALADICEEHNAALVAERELREQAEREWKKISKFLAKEQR